MKTVITIARIFLGGMFIISGFNGFFHFIPTDAMPGSPMGFLSSMVSTGDFFYVIKFFEIIGGIMIMGSFYMPIALIMMFPITMNIFMFHMTGGNGGIPIAFMLFISHIYMIYMHRERYTTMIHN